MMIDGFLSLIYRNVLSLLNVAECAIDLLFVCCVAFLVISSGEYSVFLFTFKSTECAASVNSAFIYFVVQLNCGCHFCFVVFAVI